MADEAKEASGGAAVLPMDIEAGTYKEPRHPGKSVKLAYWDVNDVPFWEKYGVQVARRNLWSSIPNLLASFATWIMWSIIAVKVQKAHDNDPTAFPFNDWSIDSNKDYKAAVTMLPAVAGLAGATLRLPNSFMIAVCGGRNVVAVTSMLMMFPMLGAGIALADRDIDFLSLVVLAALSGFGGGVFASSMSNISFFFPKAEQGLALGLNAGIGNLGVSVTQLLVPIVMSGAAFGGSAIGGIYPQNAGWFWLVLLAIFIIPAWFFMNNMPDHANGPTWKNILKFLQMEFTGIVGVVVGVAVFVGTKTAFKTPGLIILQIFLMVLLCCFVAMLAMKFLVPGEIKVQLAEQQKIFKNKHTWWMTYLYIMTFGSFIGYSSAFPKIILDIFGYMPDGSENPNAPKASHYAWLGACVGSLLRPLGGMLSDKYGGARVTHYSTITQVVFTILTGVFISVAKNADSPETAFVPFLLCFLVLFASTGIGNGSTFRMMAVIFDRDQAGPVLGWTSAIAAYGAAVFPAIFAAAIKGGVPEAAMYGIAGYYATCIGVNWWYYYRKGAEKPC